MPPDRLRSIVPMFGGATRYVETLDEILAFVATHEPSTAELVGWHRGSFTTVSSRGSIMRRVQYLQQAEFLDHNGTEWRLGPAGKEYRQASNVETLLGLMCERNVRLRSLLHELSAGPMTIAEISEQQLDTHPELGWSRGETDMAKQRANWLRSMEFVEKRGAEYVLTDSGWEFVDGAVSIWANSDWSPAADAGDEMSAGTYETRVHVRSVDPEFRATVLSRHDRKCSVSDVDHPGLLDVAHILSWSEFPEYRADIANVVPLSKTHHAAFDRGLFTTDQDYRLCVNPSFETQSELLQRTILEQAGERLMLPEGSVKVEYLAEHNAALAWM